MHLYVLVRSLRLLLAMATPVPWQRRYENYVSLQRMSDKYSGGDII